MFQKFPEFMKSHDGLVKVKFPIPKPTHTYPGLQGFLYRSLFQFFYYIRRLIYKPLYLDQGLADDLDQIVVVQKPRSLEALLIDTKFTKRELKILYRGFKQTCPNGVVSLDQFKTIFSSLFPHGNCDKYAHFVFHSFKPQRKDYLSFEEVVVNFSRVFRGGVEQRMNWVWEMYDTDGDDLLYLQDLHRVLDAVFRLLGAAVDVPPDRFHVRQRTLQAFNKLDLNGDGVVTRKEFMDVCFSDPDVFESLFVFDKIPIC